MVAKKKVQQSDEEIALRAISQARQIDGRLFVSQEGVFLVRGMPAFARLCDCLASCQEPPGPEQAPAPAALGFPISGTVALTGSTVGTWARALQKWRRILDDYEGARQDAAERRRKYRSWREEIEELTSRLSCFQDALRAWERAGAPVNAPYVLAPGEEAALRGALAEDYRAAIQDPWWRWLARVVTWTGGMEAGRRFLASLAPFGETAGEYEERVAVRRLKTALEHAGVRLPGFDNASALPPLKSLLDRMPLRAFSRAGFKRPKRGRDLLLTDLYAGCVKVESMRPPSRLVARAAALCALDGAQAPVPRCLLTPEKSDSRTGDFLAAGRAIYDELFEESGRPAYDLLLRSLDSIGDIANSDVRVLRLFLDAGVDIADADWAVREFGWRAEDCAREKISPAPLRRLCARIQESGIAEDEIVPSQVAGKLAEHGGVEIIEAFADWVALLDGRTLTRDLALAVWNRLVNVLALERACPEFRTDLRAWSAPRAARPSVLAACGDVSPEAAFWLARLAYYQELGGQTAALPKSLGALLKKREREQGELAYLQGIRAAGGLDAAMAARLALLEGRPARVSGNDERKLLRQAQEVCARVALDAVRTLARRASHTYWQRTFGCAPPEYLSDDEVIDITAWTTSLDKQSAYFLRELSRAWRAHGGDYRSHLEANRGWLGNAARRGIDVARWLAPAAFEGSAGGLPVRIEVSRDPFRIFLMGNYFGTCLSLDECNKNSVLANAHDANKNVIFAFGPRGEVLARKLVGINAANELVGYRTYVGAGASICEKRRELISSAIAAFCGKWARELRVPLGHSGQPGNVAGLFWYDDGVEAWSPAAYAAYDDHGRDLERAMLWDFSLLDPRVLEVLGRRQKACVRILGELDICPLAEDGTPANLAETPGLAEEALALLGLRERDLELARLIFQRARTRGGRAEAVRTMALLAGEAFLPELAKWARVQRHDCRGVEWAAHVLREIGTPAAWDNLVSLALSSDVACQANMTWIVLGAAQEGVAAALKRDLPQVRKSNRFWDSNALLMVENMLAGGRMALDGLIQTLLSAEHGFGLNIESLAQWLPPLRKERVTVGSLIGEILDRQATDTAQERTVLVRAAITVAFRNPGPGAIRFLKKEAEREPAALLALSLLEPRRFQAFILQTALSMPEDPAALMALVHAAGRGKAEAAFQAAHHAAPGQRNAIEYACRLYSAYRNLDLPSVNDFADSRYFRNTLNCFPILLDGLWRILRLDAPDLAAIERVATCGEVLRWVFDATGIHATGLAVRLAHLLRISGDAGRASLANALLRVLSLMPNSYHDAEFLVPLDALSGHRAFVAPQAFESVIIGLDDILEYGACASLVFDDRGNPRPWVEVAHWEGAACCTLPPDHQEARRLTEFLLERTQWDNPLYHLEPLTEIQKRLVMKAAEKKNTSRGPE